MDLPSPESDYSFPLQLKDKDPETSELTNAGVTHPRTRFPRISEGSGKFSQQCCEDVCSGKTLLGIEYITQMPSSGDDRVSLPPLKSQCSTYGSLCSPTSGRPRSSDGMAMLSTSAAASRGKKQMQAPQEWHYGREMKLDRDKARLSPMAPTAPNPRNLPKATPNMHPEQSAPTTDPTSRLTPPALASTIGFDVPSSAPAPPTSAPFPTLESRLLRLRQYADELLSLSLHESYRLLQCEIRRLEETLLMAKKERSETLIRGLEAEFPNLVDIRERIKREGGKLGYF